MMGDRPDSGEPEPLPASRWQRLRRDPFAWALVIGLALVTLSVPFFRNEPPAPAPLADMPAWSFADASGSAVSSASLAGRTYMLVLTSGACEGSCARVGRDLARMQELLAAVKADASLVTVDVGGADAAALSAFLARSGGESRPGPGAWLALSASPEAACALVAASFARVREIRVPCERVHDLADDPHALVVDGQGRIRACIRLDRQGLDETFHRTLAVVENRPIATTP